MPKPQISEEREKYWLSALNSIMGDFHQKRFYATFPKIQEAFNQNIAKIAATYPSCPDGMPKFLFRNSSFPGCADNECPPFACGITDDKEIHLVAFLPGIERVDRGIRAEKHIFGEIDSTVRLFLLIGLMHELDHMALGVIDVPRDVKDILDGEGIVWAKTCEDTISVLIEEYHQELHNHDKIFYSEWVKSGRNVNSQSWKDFICGSYAVPSARKLRQLNK